MGVPVVWVSLERLKEMCEERAKYRCPHCDLALNEDDLTEMLYCWCGFAQSKTDFCSAASRIVEVKA